MIIVLQKGKIVEQGTHDDLIEKQGMYNKLVEMQSFA
jgi:subfamily B ATP-binding cassette protein MsbA